MRRRRLLPAPVILAGLLAAWAACAAEGPRQRVGLVLGGGGARGGAHVGVLRVLEELRVPVDRVAGTSMGALVGALYAAGYSPDEIEEILGAIPWDQAFRDAPDRSLRAFRPKQDDYLALLPYEWGVGRKGVAGKSGAIVGAAIDFILRSLTIEASGVPSFDRLRIPYRAVAMDLRTGDMVILDRGDLARAMRASMSVPGVFSPVEIDGRVLVDGGTARNIPVDVVRAMGAERVVAVDVGTPPEKEVGDLSALGVVSQTMAVLSERNRQQSREEIGPGDLLITPDLGDFGAGDFQNVLDTIAVGEAAARALEDELRRFSVPEEEYAELLRRQRRESAGERPSVRVDSIAIEGIRRVPLERVRRRIETREGEPLSFRTLGLDLQRVYQLGDFESVQYRIERGDSGNRLVLEAREKPWGPGYLRFGFALASDFEGDNTFRVIGHFRRPNVNRLGAEWKTVVALGNPLDAMTEFYQPLGAGGSWFVAPRFAWERDRRDAYLENGEREGLKTGRTTGGLDVGIQMGSHGEIRLGVLRGRVRLEPTTDTTVAPSARAIGGPRFRAAIDVLDDTFFPTRGNRTTLEAFLSRGRLGADEKYETLAFEVLQAGTLGRNTLVGKVDFGTGFGSTLPYHAQQELGGFLELSGLPRGYLRGDVRLLISLTDYWRVRKLGALGKLYVGAAIQAGNVWAAGDDPTLADLVHSGTILAGLSTDGLPVLLGVGFAEAGNRAAYFLVGRAF